MRSSLHARFVILTAAAAFAVATVFFSLWLFLEGMRPPGSDPFQQLAALEVREAGRNIGAPITWLEQARGIPGIVDVYAARPTRMMVSAGPIRSEVGAAFVTDRHFPALGILIEGRGFTRFEPWQRNRSPECVIGPDLSQRLGNPGHIEVKGVACRVVGRVASGFSGLRPPRREELWIAWHAIAGLSAAPVAPEAFLEQSFRAREAGVVLDGTRSLKTIQMDLQVSLVSLGFDRATVLLTRGEGLEPAEQRGMIKETRRLFVATLTVLLVVGAFIAAAAAWRMERDRSSLALRMVLGASKPTLFAAAASESTRQFGMALVAGAGLALVGYRGLLSVLPHSPSSQSLIPQWPTLAGWGTALSALLLIFGTTLLAQSRGIRSIPENRLQAQLKAFRSTAIAENLITGAVIGVMFLATLQLASLWLEQRRLALSEGGYTNAEVLAITPESPTTMEQAHDYRVPSVSPDPLISALMENFGKDNVALSSSLPYRPIMVSQPVVPPDGDRSAGGIQVRTNHVSDGFFRLLGMRFIEGRPFDPELVEEIVLDESAAAELLGAPPWRGGRIWFNSATSPTPKTVVGVVANLPLYGRVSEPEPTMYVPLRSLASTYNIALRADPAHAIATVPALLREHGIRAPLRPIVSLQMLQQDAEAFQRFRSGLILAACTAALVIGLFGLRAVLASVFQKRQREIAIKLALGARRSNLMWDLTSTASLAAMAGMAVAVLVFTAASGTWLGVPDLSAAEYLRLAGGASGMLVACLFAALLPQLGLIWQLQLSRTLSSE